MLYALDLETACNVPGCKHFGESMCAEGHSLSPWHSVITVIGITDGEHSSVLRGKDMIPMVTSILTHIKEAGHKVTGHGYKFDCLHLAQKGVPLELLLDTWGSDTHLLSFVWTDKIPQEWLDEYVANKPKHQRAAGSHSLKTLAPYFLGVAPYWEVHDKDDDRYVLTDTEHTHRLETYLRREMPKDQQEFVDEKLLPWTKMLVEAELRGLQVDLAGLADYRLKLEAEERELKAQLDALWVAAHVAYAAIQTKVVNFRYDSMKNTKNREQRRAVALSRVESHVSYDSPTQMAWLLGEFYGYDIRSLEGQNSTGKEVLIRLAEEGKKDVEIFLKWRKTQKILTAFIPKMFELCDSDGVTHPIYSPTGARTGRTSCIAKGELVTGPGYRKPIEHMTVGDLVYCYDEKTGAPTISKVTGVFSQGAKQCVEVKWQSSGTGRIGRLLCTPDHKIMTKAGVWKEAGSLKRYEKLTHLFVSNKERRPRVYGSNNFCEQEQLLIKHGVFNATEDGTHIHHLDENPRNNKISNLVVMSASDHTRAHAQDYHRAHPDHWKVMEKRKPVRKKLAEAPTWIELSRFSLLRMLAKAGGSPSKSSMDFATFKRKLERAGIDWKAAADRYGADGSFISRGRLLRALSLGNVEKTSRLLSIGTRKLKKICTDLGVEYNHAVCKVSPAGSFEVFDIEVEEHHNFIASEICVHNCERPNAQQVPSSLKRFFSPRQGKLIGYDQSAIEAKLIAAYTEDPALLDIIETGESIHNVNTVAFFGLDCPPSEVPEKYPRERKASKNCGFALFYNAGANRIRIAFTQAGFPVSTSEARRAHKNFLEKYSTAISYAREVVEAFEQGEIIHNLLGRPIKIQNPQDAYMTGFNTLIQSSASDINLDRMHAAIIRLRASGIQCYPVLTVHDYVGIEVIGDVEKADQIIREELTDLSLPTTNSSIKLEVDGGVSNEWN